MWFAKYKKKFMVFWTGVGHFRMTKFLGFSVWEKMEIFMTRSECEAEPSQAERSRVKPNQAEMSIRFRFHCFWSFLKLTLEKGKQVELRNAKIIDFLQSSFSQNHHQVTLIISLKIFQLFVNSH